MPAQKMLPTNNSVDQIAGRQRAEYGRAVARQIAGVVDHAPDLDHAFLAGASATRSMALLKTQK